MRPLTSTLIVGLLLTLFVNLPSASHHTGQSEQILSQQVSSLDSVGRRSQPKHRGSGRRELLECAETTLG